MRTEYTRNHRGTPWARHGTYLAREGAQREGAIGQGFSFERDDVDLNLTLRQWQRADDPWFWKFIVSPEHGERLDLRAHTRALVAQMERDLGTPLQWTAIDHHNTDQPHVHVLVRGRDVAGRPLEIAPYYFEFGLRTRSEELVTRVLGFRSEREQLAARGHAIERTQFTEIDRALLRLSGDRGLVTYEDSRPKTRHEETTRLQEMRRLQFLEHLGLAERTEGQTWRLAPTLESSLREALVAAHRIRSRKRPEPTVDRSLAIARQADARGQHRERAR